jgi:hypothetical protein
MEKAKSLHVLESGEKRRLVWWGNGETFEHSGRTLGFCSALVFDAKKRRGVVVLSNCANTGIVEAMWRPLLEGRSSKPSGTLPANSALLEPCVGQYKSAEHANISVIRREDDRLMARWIRPSGEPYAGYEVFPQSESIFRNQFWGTQLTFLYAADGQPTNMLVANLKMIKISTNVPALPAPVQIDPKLYDGYVGRYRYSFLFGLFSAGPSFNVRHETDELGDHLVGNISGKNIETYFPRLSHDILGGELFPKNETTFFNPLLEDQFGITFDQNKRGKTTHMTVSMNGKTIRVDRVSNRPAKLNL